MKAPAFWGPKQGGVRSLALAPLGWLYGAGAAVRQAVGKCWRAPVPVICVGNLIAGGAGKTPIVLDIAKRLRAQGVDAHILTRGYGGVASGPLRVTPDAMAAKVGDESLLLARAGPAWVSDDRVAGVRQAVQDGAQAIVLDDGFQDSSIAKDCSLLVIDGGYGFGNGRMIPAGPLRETIAAGLARTDATVIVDDDMSESERIIAGRAPVLRADALLGPAIDALTSRRIFAFAGIGRPAKFFEALARAGLTLADSRAFADHHPYSADETAGLLDAARRIDAVPVTTEKDWVRLPGNARAAVTAVPLHIRWRDEDALDALLAMALNRNG